MTLPRPLDLALNGPIVPLVTATVGVTVYWILRVRATRSASYELLARELGEPGRIERALLGGFVLACYALITYRLVEAWMGPWR